MNPELSLKRKGNYKAGPGRPPGRKNNATLELEKAAAAVAQSFSGNVPGAFEGDAHAFLAAVYKHPGMPMELRILAAGKALRVEKPALAATSGKLDVNINLAERLRAARERVRQYEEHRTLVDRAPLKLEHQ